MTFGDAVKRALSAICPCFDYDIDPKTGLLLVSTDLSRPDEWHCRCWCRWAKGCNIVAGLLDSGFTVPITPGFAGDSFSGTAGGNSYNKKGEIEFNPEDDVTGPPQPRSPSAILFHELIHAYCHRLRGISERTVAEELIASQGENWMRGIDRDLFAQAVVIPLFSDHGILTQVAGHGKSVVKILPPLNISEEDIQWFLNAFEECMRQLHRFPGPTWEMIKRSSNRSMKSP